MWLRHAVHRCLQIPRVLAVAGSDSGGGAGIQADLKTFQARGVFGMTAVTALTSQNTHGVNGVHTPPVDFLRRQMETVLGDLGADVVKTGMLPSAAVSTGHHNVAGGCWGLLGHLGAELMKTGMLPSIVGRGWAMKKQGAACTGMLDSAAVRLGNPHVCTNAQAAVWQP